MAPKTTLQPLSSVLRRLMPDFFYGQLTVDEARDIVAGRLIRQERRNLVGGA